MRKFIFRTAFFFLLSWVSLFVIPSSSFAVSTTIISYPSTITTDAVTLTASISGATSGTNYIKVEFYKDGTQNYFGETNTGSTWYDGSDGKQYFPITIPSGIFWNGTVQARIGNPNTTDYDGNGNYKMRVRRHTSSGNYTSSEADASSVAVNILIPTITPIPLPTHTPVLVPTVKQTATPARTPTPAPTTKQASVDTSINFPTTKDSPTSSVSTRSQTATFASALDDSDETDISEKTRVELITATPEKKVLAATTTNYAPYFIGAGIILLAACGILVYRTKQKLYEED